MKRSILPIAAALMMLTAPRAGAQEPGAVPSLRLDAVTLASVRSLSPLHAPSPMLGDLAMERAPAPMQFYYHRTDWELGRGLLGAAIGLGLAYVADLVKDYNPDFSKGNPLLNETDGDGQVQRGEVLYNILLYGGITPYYTLRSVKSVHPLGGSIWGGYLSGTVGTLLGLVYWTTKDKPLSGSGMAATVGLTSLFTTIGYHIF